MPARAGRGAGVGWRVAWGYRAPPPLAGRCAPLLVKWSFTRRAVCCRALGAGPCSYSLTASRGGGDHGGGRPLAAARGCRLLRRFFFLLRRRKVILAGPRPGQASLRSVRQRTLDMAWSARIGGRAGRRKKKKNAAATGHFAARGRTACFTPRRHGWNWRSGGSTGTRRCTAAAHSPQTNPLEEDFFATLGYPTRHNPIGALRAQERYTSWNRTPSGTNSKTRTSTPTAKPGWRISWPTHNSSPGWTNRKPKAPAPSSTTVVDSMLTWFHTLSGGRNHGAVAGAGARPRRRAP